MPVPVVCAQLVHAAGETGPTQPGTYAVVLSVANQEQLYSLLFQLEEAGVECHPVYEPDPPYNGELMVIGLYPIEKKEGYPAGQLLRRLPLYRGKEGEK